MKKTLYLLCCVAFWGGIVGCNMKEELVNTAKHPITLNTKAINPEYYDWEVEDYMPTPPSQSILVPWATGNGGLDAFYGLDVLYDHKRVNGWRLVYSTFRSEGGALVDPYFVLYNIYRGTLRIYVYRTSITNTYSSYIQDAVYLNGVASSKILNYLGKDIIDANNVVLAYNSVRPKPLSGGAPLVNNQWYMVEYELAYDPNLGNIGYNQLRFQIGTDYYQIDSIRLSGEAKTEISGAIGANSTSALDLVHSEIENAKTGIAGILGVGMLETLGVETPQQGGSNNKVGILNTTYSSLVSAITGMASSFFGGLPSFTCSLLNAIICGSSSSAGSTVSLKSETNIQLKGTITSSGAVGNWSMYIPGTSFYGAVQGYVPLYDEILGVVNFVGDNTLYMQQQSGSGIMEMEIGGVTFYYPEYYTHREIAFNLQGGNYEDNLIFNPEVEALANISVISEDLIERYPDSRTIIMNEVEFEGYELTGPYGSSYPIPDFEYGVRFLIEVEPKDGSPASYIYKTFKLEPYLVGGRGTLTDEELKDRLSKYHERAKNN